MKSSRRKFIQTASVLAAGSVLPLEALTSSRRPVSANDKVRWALSALMDRDSVIWLHSWKPWNRMYAMCDIDRNVLNNRTDNLTKLGFPRPKLYVDYRKMLENKDIDVAIIGTPIHWHCLILVDSLEAGNMRIVKNLRKFYCWDQHYAKSREKNMARLSR